jgi:hypothetical protein
MSWSFKFVAKDKFAAHAHLARAVAPQVVKGFIAQAIDALPEDEPKAGDSKAVSVKSDGHLSTGNGDYPVSTNNTEVCWINILGASVAS